MRATCPGFSCISFTPGARGAGAGRPLFFRGMKRLRPVVFHSFIERSTVCPGIVASLHEPLLHDFTRSFESDAVAEAAQGMSTLRPTLNLQGIRSHRFAVQALLHDTRAVINGALPGSAEDPSMVDVEDGHDVLHLPADKYAGVPDPLPPDKDWVTPGKLTGLQRPGTGRELGSGLNVRQSLRELSAVVFCRDVLSVLLRDGLLPDFHADAFERTNELRSNLAFYSDKKINGRVFSTAPFVHVGLVANFGRNGPRTKNALDQAAAIELSLVQDRDHDVACACSCAEQCLRVKCMFADDVQGAFGLVSHACGVRPAELLRAFHARLGQRRSEGDGQLFGDTLCGVRSVGGNWPWALVRRSRANFWTCMSCME